MANSDVPNQEGLTKSPSPINADTMVAGLTLQTDDSIPVATTEAPAVKVKKGTKKKLSKAEKAKEKLDKACSLLTSQADLYQNFLDRMNRWLMLNNFKVVELYQTFEKNGDGILTYDEFKAGLLDLNVPCNGTELEVLARNIDKDRNGTIDYREFVKGLSFVDEESEWHSHLATTKEELDHCSCCKLGLWKPETEKSPRYLKVHLKCGMFDNLCSYPGHFILILHSHLTIYGLIDIIKTKMDLATTTLRVYRDKTRAPTTLLMPDKMLWEYGYKGGTWGEPEDCFLYYDYSTEFHDCPIVIIILLREMRESTGTTWCSPKK